MKIGEKEHLDLMEEFERGYYKGVLNIDRDSMWPWNRGSIYQDDKTNILFLAFRNGYVLGKARGAH